MKRDISSLTNQFFDVIVVGGGIHGAAAAWQCVERGLKVALIERADFGGATSANSLKIIHGGFRYLQHLNVKRMRESIISRRVMMQLSPENVVPLRCAIPTSGFGLRNKYLMRLALFLNDIIGYDRNQGLGPSSKIPRGRVLSRQECKKIFPAMEWDDNSGGSFWYDGMAVNSERLTLAFIQKACEEGAVAANYAGLKKLKITDGRVTGVTACDMLSGTEFPISGNTVVVAAGPECDRLLGYHQGRGKRQMHWAKAVNIIVKKRLLHDTAIGISGAAEYVDSDAVLKKKGRFFFFVPWREYTMIGTTYSFCANNGEVTAERQDVIDILNEVNDLLPESRIAVDEVTNVHSGIVPAYMIKDDKHEVQLVKETEIADLSTKPVNPVAGLFAIKTVKYTTAPVVGAAAAGKIMKYLTRAHKEKGEVLFSNYSAELQWPDADEEELELYRRYGRNTDKVSSYIKKNGELLCDAPFLYAGEVDYFIFEEMAMSLADVVFRRSEIGTAECPSADTLKVIAARMAHHLFWDEEQVEREIRSVVQRFSWLPQQ